MGNGDWPMIGSFKGYVTTYSAISRRSSADIERSLGFNAGRLAKGYAVYALIGLVNISEFEWRDRTRYSAGWHPDPSIKFGTDPSVIWCVQRRDELRAAMLKKHGGDERAADAEITKVLEFAASRLNMRVGADRIIKLIPAIRTGSFPDSDYLDVPQWELTVEKQFQFLEAKGSS
jgi:hypothetical protein